MGYFSNDSEGYDYEAAYCSKCVHSEGEDGNDCAVWLAHMVHSYDECNDDKSILHMLIPRKEPLGNEQCRMFLSYADVRKQENRNQLSLFDDGDGR